MDNAKKMLLIEPSLFEKLKQSKTTDTPLSRLDSEMQNILNNDMEDRKKCILYLQTLQRYLNYTKEDRQPLHIPIINTTEIDGIESDSKINIKKEESNENYAVSSESSVKEVRGEENKNEPPNSFYTTNHILSLIPKTYTKKGELLLNLISVHKNKIIWDETGTIFIDNKKIAGSNIVDLVNDSLRPLKKSEPIGWETFVEALKDIKVPLTYIGNPKRQEFITRLQSKKPENHNTSAEELFSTPLSSKKYVKKIKNKLEWEKWTPY